MPSQRLQLPGHLRGRPAGWEDNLDPAAELAGELVAGEGGPGFAAATGFATNVGNYVGAVEPFLSARPGGRRCTRAVSISVPMVGGKPARWTSAVRIAAA